MHCTWPTSVLKNTASKASETWLGKISVALLCLIRVSLAYFYKLHFISGLPSTERYSYLIRELVEVSSEDVYKYVATEPSIIAAMAQRASVDLKIRQSIEYVTPN